MKPNNETPPSILDSGIKGSPLTTTIAGYVSVVLPERSGYQDTVVQADMMAQLARYGLTFGDIKE